VHSFFAHAKKKKKRDRAYLAACTRGGGEGKSGIFTLDSVKYGKGKKRKKKKKKNDWMPRLRNQIPSNPLEKRREKEKKTERSKYIYLFERGGGV